ncbi:hypothetical protein FACS1894186_3280 [Alphaproteobacteria bacterium]|nr:hypothetical protein FACS1894186_3280 [Alphaproteobacteria bacterium]
MKERDPYADADLLARTIWAEARGEGASGMAAVACVVVNRVRAPCWWGDSVASVCRAPWQFSCWNKGEPNGAAALRVGAGNAEFVLALRLATRAVMGALPDSTGGATHYHAASVLPRWAKGRTPCAIIGNHLFYKGIG